MPRWEGTKRSTGVAVFPCALPEITDEHIAPMAQQIADGIILIIATQRQSAEGMPIWLRVWHPGRWIYLAAFDAPDAEVAARYAREGTGPTSTRDPDHWSLTALQRAAQTAIQHFYALDAL